MLRIAAATVWAAGTATFAFVVIYVTADVVARGGPSEYCTYSGNSASCSHAWDAAGIIFWPISLLPFLFLSLICAHALLGTIRGPFDWRKSAWQAFVLLAGLLTFPTAVFFIAVGLPTQACRAGIENGKRVSESCDTEWNVGLTVSAAAALVASLGLLITSIINLRRVGKVDGGAVSGS